MIFRPLTPDSRPHAFRALGGPFYNMFSARDPLPLRIAFHVVVLLPWKAKITVRARIPSQSSFKFAIEIVQFESDHSHRILKCVNGVDPNSVEIYLSVAALNAIGAVKCHRRASEVYQLPLRLPRGCHPDQGDTIPALR